MAPSGPRVHVRAVVGRVHDDRVVRRCFELVEQARAAHPRSCRDRPSCRDSGTGASAQPGRHFPASCACAGACASCSPTAERTALPAVFCRLMNPFAARRRTRRRRFPCACVVSGLCLRFSACLRGPSGRCSVESSLSVAQQWSTPRGPNFALKRGNPSGRIVGHLRIFFGIQVIRELPKNFVEAVTPSGETRFWSSR